MNVVAIPQIAPCSPMTCFIVHTERDRSLQQVGNPVSFTHEKCRETKGWSLLLADGCSVIVAVRVRMASGPYEPKL